MSSLLVTNSEFPSSHYLKALSRVPRLLRMSVARRLRMCSKAPHLRTCAEARLLRMIVAFELIVARLLSLCAKAPKAQPKAHQGRVCARQIRPCLDYHPHHHYHHCCPCLAPHPHFRPERDGRRKLPLAPAAGFAGPESAGAKPTHSHARTQMHTHTHTHTHTHARPPLPRLRP